MSSVESAIGQEKTSPIKLKKMSEHIWKINEFFQELNKMNLDDFEFAFLRFIVLFTAGEFLEKENAIFVDFFTMGDIFVDL